MGRVRIKVCGITRPEDALAAAAAGVDAIGLNFYPSSPRFVRQEAAEAILQVLPPFVDPVALFVQESLETVYFCTWQLRRVRTIQWHGKDPELPSNGSYGLVPAFGVSESADLDTIRAYVKRCREAGQMPAAVLVDARVPGLHGGTGRTIPWHLLAGFDPGVPLILAGGLKPENVAEAIRIVRPYAVDVAGGVESAPGIKDADRMRQFVDAAHG